MTIPHFVDRADWLIARKQLLEKEKAFTQARDKLSAERRTLPLVKIEKPYCFQTVRGEAPLAALFQGCSQLIVYHFMFGKDWLEGCPSCSFWMDNLDGIDPHLAARDTAFVAVSTAPLDQLLTYKERMGWRFDWVSSGACDFNADFGVTFLDQEPGPTGGYNYKTKVPGEEMPGLSVFQKFDDGSIGHSYSTYARGLDMLNGTYQLLDLTPKGRDEAGLPFTMAWVKRRDQYGDSSFSKHSCEEQPHD